VRKVLNDIAEQFGKKVGDAFKSNIIREFISFVKFPIYLIWLLIPLALYGYIKTQDMLLYLTFIALLIFNILASIIVYFVIKRAVRKQIELIFKSVDSSIDNFKEVVNIIIESIKEIFKKKKNNSDKKEK
jgi:ABC-type bacteriocin/lantibiotic exporter with double-glycine peptidase domain